MPDEDAQLLRRYVTENSEAAFTELVRRHLDLVYGVALRQVNGNAALAEDIAQIVFALLARKASALTARPVLGGWLYRASQCAAIDAIRAENRRRARETQAELMQSLHSDLSVDVDWEKVRPTLGRAIAGLREADRDAIVLRFFERKSFAEIGARLALTENAARMRVERALEKLRVMLARRGVTSTGAALAVALGNQAVGSAPAGLVAAVAAGALTDVAASAGGAVTLAAIWQFMSTTKFAVGAAAIAVLAVATAGYEMRAQRAAEVLLAAAKRNHALLAGRLPEAQDRAIAAEGRVAELKSRVAAAASASTEEPPTARAEWDPKAEGKRFLERHPEVRQAYADYVDAQIEEFYGDWWKARALTPSQIEQFKNLSRGDWTFLRNITTDKKQASLTLEGGPVDPAERDAAYRAMLGEELFKEYRERRAPFLGFQAEVRRSAQNDIRLLASGICFSETPLTPEQAQGLTQILGDSVRRGGWLSRDWNAIDVKAKAILQPTQYPVWDAYSAFGRAQLAATRARYEARTNPTAKK